MTAPGELAAALERSDLPPGEGERFAGYGIMAQPFRSGHVLALRRFPHTSIGKMPVGWRRSLRAGRISIGDEGFPCRRALLAVGGVPLLVAPVALGSAGLAVWEDERNR